MSQKISTILVSPFVEPAIHYESLKPFAIKMGLLSDERSKDLKLLELEKLCLDNLKVDYVDEKVTEDCFEYFDELVDFGYSFYDIR